MNDLINAALNGQSDIFIVREGAKQLQARMEKEGRSSCTVGEYRKILRGIAKESIETKREVK